MMTPRELVKATLEFRNTTEKIPKQQWVLPWAESHYPELLNQINAVFPDDIITAPTILSTPTKTVGDAYSVGDYVDEWGCKFVNIHKGIIGEVKEAIIKDEDWEDAAAVHIPEELLTFDVDKVNEFCRSTDKFVMMGGCPRPFEQLQFLRTTEELYMDLADPCPKMLEFIAKMHEFYCRLVTKWAQTEVDAVMFMDDWGSQNSLLINPITWVEIFKPMYKDYIDIAHRHGKKAFMHSDGNTLQIYPHLIEIGLDAFNSQIFCIGIDNLKQFKGKITFWGEIDRQHILPEGSIADIDCAVQTVYDALWENGGCIAQCEFGPGAKPENIYRVFEAWRDVRL